MSGAADSKVERFMQGSGIPERGEALVGDQSLSNRLRTLSTDGVAIQPAKQAHTKASTSARKDVGCQRLLTVKASTYQGAAYSREVRLWLTARASPIAFAPSSPIPSFSMLQRKRTQNESTSARKHGVSAATDAVAKNMVLLRYKEGAAH